MAIMNSDPAARGAQARTAGGGDLEQSLTAVQQQCEAMLRQMTEMRTELSELTGREKVLRAILERNNELEPYEERLRKILGKIKMANEPVVAIDSATLHLEPFPYAVVDHVLPAAFYNALLTGIPPVEMFETKSAGKQHLDVPLSLAPTYSHLVWRGLAGELVPEVIAPRLIDKFRAPLDEWISRNWPDMPPRSVELHGSGGRIMFRRRGYQIRPHRDPKWSFMTCILYLARPEDNEAWGTQLYNVVDDQEAHSAAPYWIDEAKCRLVRDVEFKPNRLLVFLNSGGAHGASIPADALPENLERYIYQFRVGPGVETVARLRAMLPEERAALWTGKALVDY
jgi:hypothetical protein